jgi:uncharacterized membrane protein
MALTIGVSERRARFTRHPTGSRVFTDNEEAYVNVVIGTKEHVKRLAEKVADKVLDTATTESKVQAVTIGRPRHEVLALFQDPNRLSEVFGDIADVSSTGPQRLRWKFALDGSDLPEWECLVITEGDDRLRFVDADRDSNTGIVIDFRDAPRDRGTEVIARVSSPAPGALSGVLTFKALYRARALVLTGEVPTIKYNPSARDSDR